MNDFGSSNKPLSLKGGFSSEKLACISLIFIIAAVSFAAMTTAGIAPSVNFTNLKHYARVSGRVSVGVRARDAKGVSRIELYVENRIYDARNFSPAAADVQVFFDWNTVTAPNGKQTVRAAAYDAAGVAQTTTIVVSIRNSSNAAQPPDATFSASPASIFAGQSAVLSWTTRDATAVAINQNINSVALNGSITVSPAATTTYTLTATNAAGNAARTVVVTVTPAPGGANVVLSPALKYQTISGWEATAQAGQLYSPAWNNYKNNLLDHAAADLGINRIRVEIFSGAENPTDYFTRWRAGQMSENDYNATRYQIINDDANPNAITANGFQWSQIDSAIDNIVLPMRQRLVARGEQLQFNVNYVDFGSSTFEHKNNPAEYAEFVLATYKHIQSKYGFVPDSWEVILEPDTSNAAWTAGQVGQVIKAAGDLIAANGFTPRFVAPSTTNAANAPVFIDQIAKTGGAMPYVHEFSYHRYCCASSEVLQRIAERAAQHGKRSAMLEWIGADYQTLHEDLKLGRVSAWQQYTLAGPLKWGADIGDRYYLIDDGNAANPVIITGSRTKFLRQYFKFIRAGAQRIEASSTSGAFDPLAFINSNGKFVVVVKASDGGVFNVQNLPAGVYGIKYTTAAQFDADLPDAKIAAGQPLAANIPAAGVITIYAR